MAEVKNGFELINHVLELPPKSHEKQLYPPKTEFVLDTVSDQHRRLQNALT
ncbi:hypothetical protein D3C84_1150110 [compost metagenome]